MKKIPLSQSETPEYFAEVDDRDFAALAQYNWSPLRVGGKVVAVRHDTDNSKLIYMHRQILNAPPDVYVRHKDNNGLNNRRKNLSTATRSELPRMGRKHSGRNGAPPTSQYRGVSFDKRTGKWSLNMRINGHFKHIKRYPGTPEGELEAARMYNQIQSELYGERAVLNDIPGDTATDQEGANGSVYVHRDADGTVTGLYYDPVDVAFPTTHAAEARDAVR
jgi:hypothetical protein